MGEKRPNPCEPALSPTADWLGLGCWPQTPPCGQGQSGHSSDCWFAPPLSPTCLSQACSSATQLQPRPPPQPLYPPSLPQFVPKDLAAKSQ